MLIRYVHVVDRTQAYVATTVWLNKFQKLNCSLTCTIKMLLFNLLGEFFFGVRKWEVHCCWIAFGFSDQIVS